MFRSANSVRVVLSRNLAAGEILQEETIPELISGASYEMVFTWDAPKALYGQEIGIHAVADPDNNINEADELNNSHNTTLQPVNHPADLDLDSDVDGLDLYNFIMDLKNGANLISTSDFAVSFGR